MDAILKETNLKTTKARELVLKVIEHAEFPLTAEDIYKQTFLTHNVNLSTIYRTLNTLSDKHILIKQVRQDGKAYYQFNRTDHKHLISCVSCGLELPLDHCPLEIMIKKIAKQTGFSITNHNIELYGICPNCESKTDQLTK